MNTINRFETDALMFIIVLTYQRQAWGFIKIEIALKIVYYKLNRREIFSRNRRQISQKTIYSFDENILRVNQIF